MFSFDDGYLARGATCVPNVFFTDYMPGAPGDYVKVYLYALMRAGSETDMAQVCSALAMTEEDFLKAMGYWERRRLVRRVQDNPPMFVLVHPGQLLSLPPQEDSVYETFSEALYALFGQNRKLRGWETTMAFEWVEDMGLPMEVVLMMVQHCITARGMHFGFREAQKIAVALKENGITTADAAESFFASSEAARKGAQSVLRRLGRYRMPSEDEISLYDKWTRQWQFTPKDILDACARTTASGEPTMAYLDGILSGIRERGGNAPVSEQMAREDGERKAVKELLSALGGSGRVTAAAVTYYRALKQQAGDEMILAAARYAASKNRHTFEDVDDLLQYWRKKGITTPEAAETFLDAHRNDKNLMREICEACGFGGRVTQTHLNMLSRWQNDLAMPMETVLYCAAMAAGREHPLSYMNTVLTDWADKGIRTPEQAARTAEKPQKYDEKKVPRKVAEQNYTQREREETDSAAERIRRMMEEENK